MRPKFANATTNCVDPDHTALETGWSGSALFAETYLSQYLDFTGILVVSAVCRFNESQNSLF